MSLLRKVSSVFVLSALVSAAVAGSAEAQTFRSVTNVRPGHVAWIYRHPNAASEHVGYLKAGTLRVHTIGCRRLGAGGWCHVTNGGTRGWVQDRFLKPDQVMRG